jgi:hypothetical protein
MFSEPAAGFSVSKLFNHTMVLTLPLFGRLCSSQTLSSPPPPHQPESEPKHPHFHTNRQSNNKRPTPGNKPF